MSNMRRSSRSNLRSNSSEQTTNTTNTQVVRAPTVDKSRSKVIIELNQDEDDEEEEEEEEKEGEVLPPATSAMLYPPLYGRPKPSPSPDLFATLLHPLYSLSRPPSPSPSSSHLNSLAPPSPSSDLLASHNDDRSSSSLPAHFPPRKPSDPGPTVESQGFALYLGSLVIWLAYLVWGLGSDDWLTEGLGIGWYPSREWALLFPAWTIMLAFFVYFSYIALNIFITPSLDSLHTLTDTQAYILTPPTSPSSSQSPHPLLANSILLPLDAVPVLHDLPIGLVNRVVMGDFRRKR